MPPCAVWTPFPLPPRGTNCEPPKCLRAWINLDREEVIAILALPKQVTRLASMNKCAPHPPPSGDGTDAFHLT